MVQRAGVAGDEGGRRHRDPQSHHWYRGLCEEEHSHVLPSQLADLHSFFNVGRIPDSLRNCVNKEFFVTTAPWGMMEQQQPQVHPELNGATYRWVGEHPFIQVYLLFSLIFSLWHELLLSHSRVNQTMVQAIATGGMQDKLYT